MYLLDSNILVYANIQTLPEHPATSLWLKNAVNGNEAILLTESVILSFFRLTTNSGIFSPALSVEQCRQVFERLLAYPNVLLYKAEAQHYLQLAELMEKHKLTDKQTMDAHLVCIALATKAVLVTNDKGFGKFPYVKIINPAAL